jgi:hypothetical protein
MLSDYRQKFGVTDLGHLRYALAYLDDAQRERTPKMLWPATWRTMRRAVEDAVRELGSA